MVAPLMYAYLGPTNTEQPPFCWDMIANDVLPKQQGITVDANGRKFVHDGHPDCFNFSYQLFPPSNIVPHLLLINIPT